MRLGRFQTAQLYWSQVVMIVNRNLYLHWDLQFFYLLLGIMDEF